MTTMMLQPMTTFPQPWIRRHLVPTVPMRELSVSAMVMSSMVLPCRQHQAFRGSLRTRHRFLRLEQQRVTIGSLGILFLESAKSAAAALWGHVLHRTSGRATTATAIAIPSQAVYPRHPLARCAVPHRRCLWRARLCATTVAYLAAQRSTTTSSPIPRAVSSLAALLELVSRRVALRRLPPHCLDLFRMAFTLMTLRFATGLMSRRYKRHSHRCLLRRGVVPVRLAIHAILPAQFASCHETPSGTVANADPATFVCRG